MLSRIRERKVVQWLIAYTVVAWAVLEAIELVGGALEWTNLPLRIAIILAVVGAPVIVVLGWYHGEKGRQKVTPAEAFILGALTLAGGITLVAFGTPPERGPGEAGRSWLDRAALDSTRYIVLPFRRENVAESDTGEELLIGDALGRWRGIQVVDLFQTRDASMRYNVPLDDEAAATLAAGFGAGRYVTGSVAAVGDGVRFRAVLQDTESGRTLADTTLIIAGGSMLGDTAAAAVAAHLLFRGASAAEAGYDGESTTSSFAARLAFLHGHKALQEWDLQEAEKLFSRAVEEDPAYARAHLWRAQVRNWSDEHPSALLSAAEVAASSAGLTGRERLLAAALVALARGHYPAACRAYEALRDADERDFAAWYGLGECRRRDSGVIRSPASPSGWFFRSSTHSAVIAFARAFEVFPLAHRGLRSRTFERANDLFHVGGHQLRQGTAVAPDSGVFWARASIRGDTLAFIPYRVQAFSPGADRIPPGDQWKAVQRQREMFARLAEGWVTAFPGSTGALRALALARELNGDRESLDLLRRARTMADAPAEQLEIRVEEIRLLVKLGGADNFARAAALTDTVLSQAPGLIPDRHLAEIAALTGRAVQAAAHAEEGASAQAWSVTIPAAMVAASDALLAYAALGGPADSLRAAEQRLVAGLRNRFPQDVQAGVMHFLLDRPASLAFMTEPLEITARLAFDTRYPVLRAQGLMALGDTAAAVDAVREAQARRAGLPPSTIAIESVLPEAWVLATAGNFQEAASALDASLAGLPWSDPGYLGDVAKAASAVRAMVLRADVAAALGERDMARRWGKAVAALWAGCDAHLRSTVQRMEAYANGRIPFPSP